MNRERMLQSVQSNTEKVWDVIIIGGGATGLGAAVDAASRGYTTLLVEESDFSKGTSSRSTKLVHGGVRYLAQGDLSLVFEALHERGIVMQNAPHLVHNQRFIIPAYEWWEGPLYTIGMKMYDMMAGTLGLHPSQKISTEETLSALPNLDQNGLLGGVIYYDGQFDDARLAIHLAATAADHGAVVLNYMKAVGFSKDGSGLINGVRLQDCENGEIFSVHGKSVINAAGIFVGAIQAMDNPNAERRVAFSRGVHLVVDASFLPGDTAIMIPHTSDGRVLFAVPWHGKIIIGTTDTEVQDPILEPRASDDEVQFLLKTSAAYLHKHPQPEDILSVFAGLRPLAVVGNHSSAETKDLSRKHSIAVSPSGLITITGGKWTIYRRMAEDIIDKAILVGGLEERKCRTRQLQIHGFRLESPTSDPFSYYGTDAELITETVISEHPHLAELIHPSLPYRIADIVWAVRQEMARTVEDVLARRTRALFLDARSSIASASLVAEIMAKELGRDSLWMKDQIHRFSMLASGYLPRQ